MKSISETLSHKLAQIESQTFSDVREKILLENTIPPNELDEAIKKFKKFLVLRLYYPDKPMAMPSHVVDIVWHTFILYTKQYAEFCSKTFGYFVHHEPATSRYKIKEESKSNFVSAYKKHFGEIPPIRKNNAICQNVPPGDCGDNDCGVAVNAN